MFKLLIILFSRKALLISALFVFVLTGCTSKEKVFTYNIKLGSKPSVTPSTSSAHWWLPRHQAIVKRVNQGNVDLIMIGDSITHFWETSGKTVWEKYYGNRNAVNLGFSGDMTQDVLWRIENGEVNGISPKLAILLIGTNNANICGAQDIADGIIAICQQLRANLPRTKLLLLAIFPRSNQPDKMLVIKETNMLISQIADNRYIYFLDLTDKFVLPNGRVSPDLMPDLIHPNQNGYEVWAKEMEPLVKAILSE